MVQVKLNGFYRPDVETSHRVIMKMGEVAEGMLTLAPSTPVRDARQLQASAPSEASFFHQHGFVLLSHKSAVTKWEPEPAPGCIENEIASVYLPEIEALIRSRLLPDRGLEIHQNGAVLRRGRETGTPFYGTGVHQDYGLTCEDYQENLEATKGDEAGALWRERYNQNDVNGFMIINFWRTTNMTMPLRHMPLAVCDPASVDLNDILPVGLVGVTRSGKPTLLMGLRFNAHQAWYYYPDMLTSEVLALKAFQCLKGAAKLRLASCFHSAFEDPNVSKDVEERQSCEHRVGVFCLHPQSSHIEAELPGITQHD